MRVKQAQMISASTRRVGRLAPKQKKNSRISYSVRSCFRVNSRDLWESMMIQHKTILDCTARWNHSSAITAAYLSSFEADGWQGHSSIELFQQEWEAKLALYVVVFLMLTTNSDDFLEYLNSFDFVAIQLLFHCLLRLLHALLEALRTSSVCYYSRVEVVSRESVRMQNWSLWIA